MNKARRAQIAKAKDLLEQAREILEVMRDEEQAYYDAMPESLRSGTRGEEAETAVQALDDAQDNVSTATDYLDGIV